MFSQTVCEILSPERRNGLTFPLDLLMEVKQLAKVVNLLWKWDNWWSTACGRLPRSPGLWEGGVIFVHIPAHQRAPAAPGASEATAAAPETPNPQFLLNFNTSEQTLFPPGKFSWHFLNLKNCFFFGFLRLFPGFILSPYPCFRFVLICFLSLSEFPYTCTYF